MKITDVHIERIDRMIEELISIRTDICAELPDLSERIDRLMHQIAQVFNVQPINLINRSRKRDQVDARCVLCYFLSQHFGLSSVAIGRVISRDHSSVLYLLKKYDALIQYDKTFQEKVSKVGI